MNTVQKVLRGVYYGLVACCLALFALIAIVAPFRVEGWQGPVVSAMAVTPHVVVLAILTRRRGR